MDNGYYYLNDRYSFKRNGVRYQTLKKDIERGVKHISSWSYLKFYGGTAEDMKLLNVLSKFIAMQGVKAEMKDGRDLIITTTEGYTIRLMGCTGGYYGQGTRGCHDALKAFGFNEIQCNKPFKFEDFKVYNRSV